jgi:isoamylase
MTTPPPPRTPPVAAPERLSVPNPELWPGQPFPMGAVYDGAGTNFSVFSEVADHVELCLFDDDGDERRIRLPEVQAFMHHGYLPGIGPGQRYGFRVHGPWAPEEGHRCNPSKLLLDPLGKAFEGTIDWDEAIFPYRFEDPDGPPSETDSAPFMPRSVVHNPYFDWGDDRHPNIPPHETVIYETHVRGLTARHPAVPAELRGTYAGLAHPEVVDYLLSLGVTSVELMPIHQFVHDHDLVRRGLRNYWGYNSVGYLAPHNEYAAWGDRGEQVQEFKQMVRTLHQAGIEVILDVVYNHTAEGNHLGPMLCLRGIDNAAYYRLDPEDRSRYVDYTGTGNTLNMRHPHVLQLIMDSLRYWVTEMHVDGFRFDLAATLARELHDVDRLSAFFDIIHQDPVLSQTRLIAEPWDVGEGGYQVGNFPPLWAEWNGKYRDHIRDYWRGVPEHLDEFANRLTGSSDLYESNGRRPVASINFVTCHDGFTLADLVSYEQKHNEQNGEDNRDGTDDNRSWNCGAEGPTDDQEVLACRARQQRNLLVTLMLSQGIPMLLGGDEMGRTQQGNNNAYCQDQELSWYDWENIDEDLLAFTRDLIRFRRDHANFRRRRWFQGRTIRGSENRDIAWFTPAGDAMTDDDWNAGFAQALTVYLNGQAIASTGPRGEPIRDDTFLALFNANDEAVAFVLPDDVDGPWVMVIDTDQGLIDDSEHPEAKPLEGGAPLALAARSVLVLRLVNEP